MGRETEEADYLSNINSFPTRYPRISVSNIPYPIIFFPEISCVTLILNLNITYLRKLTIGSLKWFSIIEKAGRSSNKTGSQLESSKYPLTS